MDARERMVQRLMDEIAKRHRTWSEVVDLFIAEGWQPSPEPEPEPDVVEKLARELHDIGKKSLVNEPAAVQWVGFDGSISAKACRAIAAHVRRMLRDAELRGVEEVPMMHAPYLKCHGECCGVGRTKAKGRIMARYPDVKD